MADNVTLNLGSGGDTIAADDVGGAKYQRVKLSLGADGTVGDAPVGAGTEATVLRVTLPTDGTGQSIAIGKAAQDAPVSGNPVLVAGRASAAVPSDVSADGDVVSAWMLRSGAIANQQTFGGVLGVAGNGASGTGVQRVTIANDSTGILAAVTNVATIGTSVTPGTAAANLGKASDAAAGATDTGVASLYIRDDVLTTITPVDGDYAPGRLTSTGAQWVAIASGGIAGIVDDAAFTPGTSEVLPIGFEADETATDSVDEGDIGAARMSLDRKQYAIAHAETGTVYQNGTARTPAFAAISGATNGDNTLLAAAGASNKIRVLSLYLVSAGTTTVRFESGAGGTALSGVMSLIANTGFVLPYSPVGHFETAANTLLNMELNAAVQVSGCFTYIVVT